MKILHRTRNKLNEWPPLHREKWIVGGISTRSISRPLIHSKLSRPWKAHNPQPLYEFCFSGIMLWIFRYFLLCVSSTNLVAAGDQCRIEINIRGMALKGFVFKRMTVAALHICDILCERESTCQSYNFNRKEQICELNNRTKDARPENFR